MIEANLADGRVLRFPDGTDPIIIQTTVKRVLSQDTKPSNIIKAGVVGGPETLGQMPEIRPDAAVIPAAMSVASGAIAEPVAGIAGIAGSVLPGEQGQGAEMVRKTREALTFQPENIEAIEALKATGEFIEPVAGAMKKAETYLGDKAFELTGSPAIAALATTAPTIATELLGYAVGKGAIKATQKIKQAKAKGQIATEISEAVPSKDQIKDVAREVYNEIDQAGAYVKKESVNRLIKKIKSDAVKYGIDKDITPNAVAALNKIESIADTPVPVTEIDRLRRIVKGVIKPVDPQESALAMGMIDNIDTFLDKANKSDLMAPTEVMPDIGKKYKIARDLWGRVRKTELLEDAFEKARNQASGFENGLRTQFRSIINNKKQRKFFNKGELEAMTNVVRGGKGENIAKLVGRLGFFEGGATNVLGGAVGVGGGAAVGGPVGAVTVPLIGQLSRQLAQRMTRSGAEFADQVIRAGKNAEKITQAYIKNTPKKMRSPQELSELLMRQDIDISRLPDIDIIGDAKRIAQQNRQILAGSIAAESTIPQE